LLARAAGPRAVMLDPNIRPGFIEDASRYRARLNAMLAHTDIVKVSDEDLAWILPDSASEAERVATLRKRGPAVVIVTRGGDGATGYLADGAQVQVPAAQVTVVDTVGAGDTFNAGVLAKLARMGHLSKDALASLSGDALQQAMAFGAKVAGVTVSRAGANPPWAQDL
ncbi:PfkB family carbohydrate kinase, partial [Thalassorhabdomicrobium marinisediminis]|uniref:PfkB family carbohydrate kinase n=1 Tax=Thalassorhabdomicrobium marinisediminis TaxID=2170577 RepID=UPI0024912353